MGAIASHEEGEFAANLRHLIATPVVRPRAQVTGEPVGVADQNLGRRRRGKGDAASAYLHCHSSGWLPPGIQAGDVELLGSE